MKLIEIGKGLEAPCFFCGKRFVEGEAALARPGYATEKIEGKETPSHLRPVMFLHPHCATELMVRLGSVVYMAEQVLGKRVTDSVVAEVVIKGLDARSTKPPKGTWGE